MFKQSAILVAVALTLISVSCRGEGKMNIPADFPVFSVPGHEKEMESLRELYWLHYPGSGPKATIWDQWLVPPSLWPAVGTDKSSDNMRNAWHNALSGRGLDSEGYVFTHQHASIAHPQGWPFPFWIQGQGGFGWHFSFSDTIGLPWRPDTVNKPDDWKLQGASDAGISEDGWVVKLTEPRASATAPVHAFDTYQSPFVQLRWKATELGNAQPYLEWSTKDEPAFDSDRRMYFDPVEGPAKNHTVIPVYKHPKWTGEIRQLRVGFGNSEPGAEVTIQALFSTYDTRHDINGSNFVTGCTQYFRWTRDLNFLRENINRMRTAMRYMNVEHQVEKKGVIYNTWIGHDGRTGLKRSADGKKEILSGHGIGDNYWDLLPFGNLDCYATILYCTALNNMAEIERLVKAHPEWNIPLGGLALDPDELEKTAENAKKTGNKLFWNSKTGRFVPNVDADGNKHDFGFTFLNAEAIYYDFATPEHAKAIMSWLDGERVIKDDTAQGADIYHWRFAPRATTKRNTEYYLWAWSNPEDIPWGGQVQDGGAVLGWSYHDLMARIKTVGPDSTAGRLSEIVKWFDEVQAAGGYRKYYDGSREGSMQGGGTAGGLGLDMEFFESVLVPQVMLDGFLGLAPNAEGFRLDPKLPSDWPELTINQIRWHDLVMTIKATHSVIEITGDWTSDDLVFVSLPSGDWKAAYIGKDGKLLTSKSINRRELDGAFEVDWSGAAGVRFERTGGH